MGMIIKPAQELLIARGSLHMQGRYTFQTAVRSLKRQRLHLQQPTAHLHAVIQLDDDEGQNYLDVKALSVTATAALKSASPGSIGTSRAQKQQYNEVAVF